MVPGRGGKADCPEVGAGSTPLCAQKPVCASGSRVLDCTTLPIVVSPDLGALSLSLSAGEATSAARAPRDTF